MGFTVASNHDLSELSRKARKTKLPTRPMTQANPLLQFFGRFKRLEKPRWVSRLLTTPATLRPFQRSLQRAIVFSHRPSNGVPSCLKIRAASSDAGLTFTRIRIKPSLADKILIYQISVTVSAIDSTERACGRRPCRAISPACNSLLHFPGEQLALGASKITV